MTKQFLLIIFLCGASLQWHPTGHFMTARIAEIEILAAPKGKQIMEKMLGILKVIGPMTKERKHPFVESACFVDDIKYIGWKSFNKWHFYDNFINQSGKLIDKQSKALENMAVAINNAKEALKNVKISQVDDHLAKTFMLRFLIHLIGDVHQPMHAVSRFDDKGVGDAGGNGFKLKIPGVPDLHSFWDKTLKFYPDVRAPLSDNHFNTLDHNCKELIKLFPRKSAHMVERLKKTKTTEWINESFKIAKEVGYKNIQVDDKDATNYLKNKKQIIQEQLVLGGYRLADVILDLFSDPTVLDSHVKSSGSSSDDEDEEEDDANLSANSASSSPATSPTKASSSKLSYSS